MRALVQALEAGESVLGGCARRRRVLTSPLVAVDLWRCVEDGDGLRSERCHPSPVLTVLLSGASVFHEGGRAVIMEVGTALLTRPDVAYRSAHPFGCGDMGCHVRPSAALLDEIPLPRDGHRAVPLPPRAHLRFRYAIEGALAGEDGLGLEELCLALLAPSEPRAEVGTRAKQRHVELVEDAKTLLLSRLGDRLHLRDVARAVGASPFHLARLFRAHTGFSLHGYRTRMRLLRALDHVGEARGALADLALELGFSSQSHFTDAFRAAFGVPPSRAGAAPTGRRSRG